METSPSTQVLHNDYYPEKLKILTVDDEPSVLIFLEETLTNAGYDVISTTDGNQTLDLARQENPDIILLDVVMPETNGFDICDQLKEDKQLQAIPVIFLTTQNLIEDKARGFASGGVDYITKPFRSDELLLRINTHTEMFRLRRSLGDMIQQQFEQLELAKQNLREANEFLITKSPYKKVLSALAESVVKINQQSICELANDAAVHLLGYQSPLELVGQKIYKISTDSVQRTTDLLYAIEINRDVTYVDEITLQKKDGSGVAVELRIRPQQPDETGSSVVASFTDLSMRKSIEDNLYALAYKDPLTGLANRTVFTKLLTRELQAYRRNKKNIALFLLDLDRFKSINDNLGHLAGDEVLCEVASRLRNAVRAPDRIARLGGDEYSLLVDDFRNNDDLLKLANRISDRLKDPYHLTHTTVNLTISIGVAVFNDEIQTVQDLISFADCSLYKSKEKRDGNACIFSPEMLEDLESEHQMSQALSTLIERDELTIEYQPLFDTQKNLYVGAEALLRWDHPKWGRLLPTNFLPLAEKRGFIEKISYFTLHKVCGQIENWKKEGVDFGTVSVNICAKQLEDTDFPKRLMSLLDKYGVSTREIVLEVAESVLITLQPEIRETLSKLIETGVKFSIDDFGNGLSSMQILRTINSKKLKIDKAFIAGINSDWRSKKITKSLIYMGKSLGMTVIAEGVENQDQLDFLKQHDCDAIQGHIFSKALSPIEIRKLFIQPPSDSQPSDLTA